MEAAKKGGVPAKEFLPEGEKIFKRYNKTWLDSEFDTIINTAKSGKKWICFEKQNKDNQAAEKKRRKKQGLPAVTPSVLMLTYHTQEDNKVRPAHRKLNRITRPINDVFWDSFTPPNGHRCRCFLSSSTTAKSTPMKDINAPDEEEIPESFRFNPGKTGQLFSGLHPYYNVKRGDSDLKRGNFGMPKKSKTRQ